MKTWVHFRMRSLTLFVAAVFGFVAESALAADVTGTAFSIVVRNVQTQPTQQARPTRFQAPDAGGVLRLVDVRSRREIARSNWDSQLNGYFFQLPLTAPSGAQHICLALVDRNNRYVPVRGLHGNDPGTSFAHPRWEELLGRSRDLAGLKTEQATLQTRRQQSGDELQRLQAEASAAGALTPGSCPLPPVAAAPVRPADVMETAEAQQVAGGVCALHWEQAIGRPAELGRLFSEAGLAAAWAAREGAREAAARMPGVRLDISRTEASLVQDAAVKGSTFLQHADGIRMLVAKQDRCSSMVVASADQARTNWQRAIEATRTQPERERQRCEARISRIALLKQAEVQAQAYAAELDRQVSDLMRPPSSAASEPIGHQICQL